MNYKVPFVNYPLQYQLLKEEIDQKLQDMFTSGDLYLRKDTQEFEQNFAKFVGCKYGIGVNSCTDAMFLSLYATKHKDMPLHEQEVITVSHTYISTIEVIVNNGMKPILADVSLDNQNISICSLEKMITDKTVAIIPVHLNGSCCYIEEIMKLAMRYNLTVIEDSAQAVGAKLNNKPAGSLGIGCWSFYPAKILGCFGDGGMITTNNEELAERLYWLRDNGEKPKYMKTPEELKHEPIEEFGFMSVLDNIQAGILNVKLKYLPKWIERRREIAQIYQKGLQNIKNIELPYPPLQSELWDDEWYDVYQNYVIRVPSRDKVQEYLTQKGIETLVKWRVPNHKQPKLTMLHKFSLPNTEQLSREVLSLPMYPELTDEQIQYVIDVLKYALS